jgi:serine phosphatase RsbU (regulator of sigma subunit)
MSFNNLTFRSLLILVCLLSFSGVSLFAQESGVYVLTAENLEKEKSVELNKAGWKFQVGDDLNWASPQFDDSNWERVEETIIKPDLMSRGNWNGRAWFRLRLRVDDALKDKTFAFVMRQIGASEVYIDNRKIAAFGKISDAGISEENPNRLPILFRFENTGEHTIAIRFASGTFADLSSAQTRWLVNGETYPAIYPGIKDASDSYQTILSYASATSMRGGFLFLGILVALALLHFLFYIFYRVERANLFYSIYAASLGFFLLINNYRFFGHLSPSRQIFLSIVGITLLAATFLALLAFVHIAFDRRLGKFFWLLTAIWLIGILFNAGLLAKYGAWAIVPTFAAIGLTFAFCITVLVKALREKRAGAWILMIGVQLLSLGMFIGLITQLKVMNMPEEISFVGELAIILAVPIAVSVFLARNFARTNRDLSAQLVQVEELSQQKIEHERHAAELRAENERRAKELEEARQLQLSMLPKKLPNIPNLEIAAYMKPATEVGGDYYDFHVNSDGGLTVAVGDATGHGLKAGTVVTAAKALFRNYAEDADIPAVFKRSSRVIKEMNLRGLFMAMTMLKIKGNHLSICAAGMPSPLIFRAETGRIEEMSLRAMPWGSPFTTAYVQHELTLSAGDTILLMSDGFPEMFSETGEMIGDDAAAATLRETANKSAQEIINRLIETGEKWAGNRPPDDDVTFVVLKMI